MSVFSKENPHIHFVGVAGSGMNGLAHLALDLNFRASGSDVCRNRTTQFLETRGLIFFSQHQEENLTKKPDLLVTSSAIADDNIEIVKAREAGIPILHRSEFLREITKDKKLIAVTGTHGKSTTAAMIYYMLSALDQNPSYYLGASLCGHDRSSAWTKGEYFVLEADESDGSFLNFFPFISVITNIDDDHMDYYQTKDNVALAYQKFMRQTATKEGCIIINWDEPLLRELSEEFFSARLGFGSVLGSEVRLLNWSARDSSTLYQLIVGPQRIDGTLPLIGEHNLKNSMAAVSVAHALNLPLKKAVEALSRFPGVERRCQFLIRDEQNKRYLLDDYAHNPGKITSTLAGLKKAFPDCSLTAVFQPHRYSRFKTLYPGFLHAFFDADKVLVTDIFSAGERTEEDLSPAAFVAELNKSQPDLAVYCASVDEVKSSIISLWRQADQIVIFLGAGDINKIAFELSEVLGEKKEKEKRPKETKY